MIQVILPIIAGVVISIILYLRNKSAMGTVLAYPNYSQVAFLRYHRESTTSGFWYHDLLPPHSDIRGIRTHVVQMRCNDIAVLISGERADPNKVVNYHFLIGENCPFLLPRGQSLKDYLIAKSTNSRGFIWPKDFQARYLS